MSKLIYMIGNATQGEKHFKAGRYYDLDADDLQLVEQSGVEVNAEFIKKAKLSDEKLKKIKSDAKENTENMYKNLKANIKKAGRPPKDPVNE